MYFYCCVDNVTELPKEPSINGGLLIMMVLSICSTGDPPSGDYKPIKQLM